MIVRIERQLEREWRARSLPARAWHCPAGCKLSGDDDCRCCARSAFRLQCLPSPVDIQQQQRTLWDEEHLTQDFKGKWGYSYGSKMQRQLAAEQEREVQAWRPSFEISESEVAEIQQAFLSSWDGKVAPAAWLAGRPAGWLVGWLAGRLAG